MKKLNKELHSSFVNTLMWVSKNSLKPFIIRGKFSINDNEWLFWSNDIGWVDKVNATAFDFEELYHINLPIEYSAIIFLESQS